MHAVIGHKIENEIIGAFYEVVVAPIIIDHIETITVKPERVVIHLLAKDEEQLDTKKKPVVEKYLRGSGVVDKIKKAGDEFVHRTNWLGQDVYQRKNKSVEDNKFMKTMASRGAHLVRRLLPCNKKG